MKHDENKKQMATQNTLVIKNERKVCTYISANTHSQRLILKIR